MRSLVTPPAVERDGSAVQVLGAWIAENGLHCATSVGLRPAEGRGEPVAWGILLADIVRHLGTALPVRQGGVQETVERIVDSMLEELCTPSSRATAILLPDHP